MLDKLKDYSGKEMKIKKCGAIFPIDVELKYENDTNVLYISSKVNFIDSIISAENVNIEAWENPLSPAFLTGLGITRFSAGGN